MIHVTCGSYLSTSLEIFLNFFASISYSEQKKYLLHINTHLLKQYAKQAGCSFNNCNISEISDVTPNELCAASIESALSIAKKNDLLLTLPAAKADLIFGREQFLGHTEFLRSYWNLPSLPMTFITPSLIMLLLTDHIPLQQITQKITSKLICEKITLFFNSYPKFNQINRVIFWGINPHAGENKTLGLEEQEISNAIKILKNQFPQLTYIGPIPSDGLFTFKNNTSATDLIVSPYHDQGLVFLKSTFGFMATNVTFGGPIIRFSPDHGTAKDLLYKKKALYSSLLWTHQLLKSWSE